MSQGVLNTSYYGELILNEKFEVRQFVRWFELTPSLFNLQMDRNNAQSEWAVTVKYLLSQIGMNNHLSDPLLANTNTISKMCTTKLRKQFRSQWHSQINGGSLGVDSNKMRFYKAIQILISNGTIFELDSQLPT